MMYVFQALLIISCEVLYPNAVPVEIKTNIGTFLGTTGIAHFNGKSMDLIQFLGIPYAEAPVGKLRFQKSIPKSPLSGVYNATYMRPGCMQTRSPFTKVYETSEDCLFLNIYIPGTKIVSETSANLAVMIWIYGGGLNIGSSNEYIPDVLCSFGDIIVVTFNYRVSAFGFLTTGDDVAPGNNGLWDQHFAIKWVHENIKLFGGDSDRVTITGESAGGSSALYQALYAGNKGLFQRVITQSGTPGATWASLSYPNANVLGSYVGCEHNNSRALFTCIKQKSLENIMGTLNKIQVTWESPPFSAIKDGDFVMHDPKEPAVFETLWDLEHFKSLDFLSGINSMDGSLFLFATWMRYLNITDPTNYEVPRSFFETIAVPTVIKNVFPGLDVPKQVLEAVKFQYIFWKDPENPELTRNSLMHLDDDTAFLIPAIRLSDLHARMKGRNSKTFMYRFTVRPTIELFATTPLWVSEACHAVEISFIYGFSRKTLDAFNIDAKAEPTLTELKVSEDMMTMWSNFVKHGNPNGADETTYNWPEYTNTNREYLEISLTSLTPKQRLGEPGATFWLRLVPSIMANCGFSETSGRDSKMSYKHTEL